MNILLFFVTFKRQLAKLRFHIFERRRKFLLLKGRKILNLHEIAKGKIDFPESICNAGLVRVHDSYVLVAKNQKFSFCHEINVPKPADIENNHADDGIRALYRIDLDSGFRVKAFRKLRVFLDGKLEDPVIFIEDVRLIAHGSAVVVFANGNGAWPLIGILEDNVITLRTAIAAFRAPQKNWMPFSHDNEILLEYSIEPHLILKAKLNNAECTEYCNSVTKRSPPGNQLHGGAPSLRISDDFYLGVGNSQHLYWFQERYYAAVFYLFEAKDPFRIVKMSSPVRIQSRDYRIQYICGLILSEDEKDLILSIGMCDCDNMIIRVSMNQVLELLQDLC